MAKLAIGFCALLLACTAFTLNVRFSFLSTYSEGLKTALDNFQTEVDFVINEAQIVVTEEEKLFEIFYSSATTIQKNVSDRINNTMTGFGKDVNVLFSDASVDVSKCMTLSFAIETKATDILINTNTCVQDKLNEAQVHVEKSISFVRYILTRLDSLKNMAEESFTKTVENKNIKKFLKTKTFLKSVHAEASYVTSIILSTLSDTALIISEFYSQIISDCVPTEAVSSFINDTRLAYSKIGTCIADLNSSDADLQSLSPNALQIRKR